MGYTCATCLSVPMTRRISQLFTRILQRNSGRGWGRRIYRYHHSSQERSESSNPAPGLLRRVCSRGASKPGGRHMGCEGLLDCQHHLGVELGILREVHDVLQKQLSVTGGSPRGIHWYEKISLKMSGGETNRERPTLSLDPKPQTLITNHESQTVDTEGELRISASRHPGNQLTLR